METATRHLPVVYQNGAPVEPLAIPRPMALNGMVPTKKRASPYLLAITRNLALPTSNIVTNPTVTTRNCTVCRAFMPRTRGSVNTLLGRFGGWHSGDNPNNGGSRGR